MTNRLSDTTIEMLDAIDTYVAEAVFEMREGLQAPDGSPAFNDTIRSAFMLSGSASMALGLGHLHTLTGIIRDLDNHEVHPDSNDHLLFGDQGHIYVYRTLVGYLRMFVPTLAETFNSSAQETAAIMGEIAGMIGVIDDVTDAVYDWIERDAAPVEPSTTREAKIANFRSLILERLPDLSINQITKDDK